MFGDASSPFPLFNSKRYSGAFSLERDDLQEIDAIIISHNHYDHLNYKSITQLKDRAKHFYVPTELHNTLLNGVFHLVKLVSITGGTKLHLIILS